MASITSPEGIVNYEYDAHGRRVRTFTGTAADPVNDFHYEYDELNRLTKVTVWERNNVVLPAASREMTQYEYDLLGNLDLERKPNGVVTDYAFDALSRLDKLTHDHRPARQSLRPDAPLPLRRPRQQADSHRCRGPDRQRLGRPANLQLRRLRQCPRLLPRHRRHQLPLQRRAVRPAPRHAVPEGEVL